MLEIGMSIEQKRAVSREDSITFLGDEVQPSLSTPAMIGWLEIASRDLALQHLDSGQDTVGVRVDVRHLGATPQGAQVVYRSRLREIDGRRLTFEVEAIDGAETVGQGVHERYVIEVRRFAEGIRKKFAGRKAGG